jgi:copper(I)-binding protein
LALLLLCLPGCRDTPVPDGETADSNRSAAALEVRDARAALHPGTGVVYLTVVNAGSVDDRLLRVATAAAGVAETHETLMQDGMMRMVPRPEGFAIPAGGTLTLEPGGKHVMLRELQPPAAGAATLPLTLHFERAGAVEVQAALAAPGAP